MLFWNVLLAFGFGLFITFPRMNTYTKFIKDLPGAENRLLKDKPVFKKDSISLSCSRYEKYFNDRFSIRNILLQKLSWILLKGFHTSVVPELVLPGSSGWLYYAPCGYDTLYIAEYCGKMPFSGSQLDTLQENLVKSRDWLSQHNIELIVVLCPNKQSIYPENTGWFYRSRKGYSRREQITAALSKLNFTNYLDLTGALQKEKAHGPVYYKTDSHWNDLGAYSAWCAITEKINKKFSLFEAEYPDSIQLNSINRAGKPGDLVHMLSLDSVLTEDRVSIDIRQHKSSSMKLLVFGDSFFRALKPFVKARFDSVFDYSYWSGRMTAKSILEEKPDIVIFEVGERYEAELVGLHLYE